MYAFIFSNLFLFRPFIDNDFYNNSFRLSSPFRVSIYLYANKHAHSLIYRAVSCVMEQWMSVPSSESFSLANITTTTSDKGKIVDTQWMKIIDLNEIQTNKKTNKLYKINGIKLKKGTYRLKLMNNFYWLCSLADSMVFVDFLSNRIFPIHKLIRTRWLVCFLKIFRNLDGENGGEKNQKQEQIRLILVDYWALDFIAENSIWMEKLVNNLIRCVHIGTARLFHSFPDKFDHQEFRTPFFFLTIFSLALWVDQIRWSKEWKKGCSNACLFAKQKAILLSLSQVRTFRWASK